jgi:FSR family fosmidomycin resistance protein-like MFS transporter
MSLAAVEVCRSVMFFGASTFIELHWLRDLHASQSVAGAALGCLLGGGVIGTMMGGRIADRFGMVRTTQIGALVCLPAMVLLRVCTQPEIGLVCALLAGLALRIPFSVLIKLGQDYLPNRPGTASAVTLGLAVSAGGVSAPILGAVADAHGAHGPVAVLTILCFVPIVTFVLGLRLVEPHTLPASSRLQSTQSLKAGQRAGKNRNGSLGSEDVEAAVDDEQRVGHLPPGGVAHRLAADERGR